MNEIELINSAKQGNKNSLNTLLIDNLPILKGYVFKMTGDLNLSQDIIQDTLLKAVIHIKKFKSEAKFSTWLIKIATNTYIDYLRKNKKTELLSDKIILDDYSLENNLITSTEYKEVINILMKLSYEKRAVFVLKHYYGYKYEEIADILDCPIGTVRSRLHNTINYIISEFKRKGLM